jgi:integrase
MVIVKALTVAEVDAVVAQGDTQLQAMVLLAYRHGMRPSEVCGLRWSDIDFDAKTIRVRRLKNSFTTVQPLSEEELQAIAAQPYDKRETRIFPVDRTTFWRHFKKACKASGVAASKRHPHALKHACGFALVAANVNLAVIKAHLGHRSINSTSIYTVPNEEQVGKIVTEALCSNS